MTDSSNPQIEVKCPRCKTPTIYSVNNPYRPFCSERCKMVDLGRWADENYKIPLSETSSDPLKPDASIPDDEPQ